MSRWKQYSPPFTSLLFSSMRQQWKCDCYNYSLEPNRSEFPANYGADISMHGHFTFWISLKAISFRIYRLIRPGDQPDHTNTFFLQPCGTLRDPHEFRNCRIWLPKFCRQWSHKHRSISRKLFSHRKRTFWIWEQRERHHTPAGTSGLTDSSYYLSSQPAFWQGTSTWPSIGYPNSSGAGSIPARDRFINGTEFTVCRQEIINGISSTEFSETEFFIFPNPVNNELNFSLSESIKEKVLVQIVDLCGKVIFASIQNLSSGQNKIIDFNLQPEFTFLCITTSSHSLNQRFIQN